MILSSMRDELEKTAFLGFGEKKIKWGDPYEDPRNHPRALALLNKHYASNLKKRGRTPVQAMGGMSHLDEADLSSAMGRSLSQFIKERDSGKLKTASVAMRDELEKIAKYKEKWHHISTPSESKAFGKTVQDIVRKPSNVAKLPGQIGHRAVQGLRSAFRGKGIGSKIYGSLAIADPIMTGYGVAKHPERYSKEKGGPGRGRALGESIGSAVGMLAGPKPLLGSILTGEVGRRVGGAVGGALGKLAPRPKKPESPPSP